MRWNSENRLLDEQLKNHRLSLDDAFLRASWASMCMYMLTCVCIYIYILYVYYIYNIYTITLIHTVYNTNVSLSESLAAFQSDPKTCVAKPPNKYRTTRLPHYWYIPYKHVILIINQLGCFETTGSKQANFNVGWWRLLYYSKILPTIVQFLNRWSLQETSRVPTCCELSQSGKHGYSIEVPWSCPIMFHSYPLSWNQTVFKQLDHWVSLTCFQDFPSTYGLPLRPCVAFSMGLKGSLHLDIDASLFYLRFVTGHHVTISKRSELPNSSCEHDNWDGSN